MSLYGVNLLCRQTMRDPVFRQAMRDDAGTASAGYALDEAERTALLAGEVGHLYAMGANAFLLGYLVRFGLLGLTLEDYRLKLVAAAVTREDALRDPGAVR